MQKGKNKPVFTKAEGERQEAFLQAEARERAAEAEAKATKWCQKRLLAVIPKRSITSSHKKCTEALKQIGGSPNSKVVMMPLEAGNLIGSVAGIAELLKAIKSVIS